MYANCEPEKAVVSEPPRESMASVIKQTQDALKELLLMIGDVSMQLFADRTTTTDPPQKPETKCLFEDAQIVRNQAIAAVQLFNDLRNKLL